VLVNGNKEPLEKGIMNEAIRWAAFDFTDDEDLFLVSEKGRIYFFDLKTMNRREDRPFGKQLHPIFNTDSNSLVDSRFERTFNSLVVRTKACQFFLIKDI
jgi:hypothetical protein